MVKAFDLRKTLVQEVEIHQGLITQDRLTEVLITLKDRISEQSSYQFDFIRKVNRGIKVEIKGTQKKRDGNLLQTTKVENKFVVECVRNNNIFT
jgi:hypothetical protein